MAVAAVGVPDADAAPAALAGWKPGRGGGGLQLPGAPDVDELSVPVELLFVDLCRGAVVGARVKGGQCSGQRQLCGGRCLGCGFGVLQHLEGGFSVLHIGQFGQRVAQGPALCGREFGFGRGDEVVLECLAGGHPEHLPAGDGGAEGLSQGLGQPAPGSLVWQAGSVGDAEYDGFQSRLGECRCGGVHCSSS